MANRWNDPRKTGSDPISDPAANPDAGQDRERVREELEVRLTRSGVALTGNESDDQIVALSDAVEAFEAARARRGGDSMVNTPESSRPDDLRFVIPTRRDDESADAYIRRVRAATERLGPTT